MNCVAAKIDAMWISYRLRGYEGDHFLSMIGRMAVIPLWHLGSWR